MTQSVPIIRFGGFVPGNLREWDRVFVALNSVIRQVGGQVEIDDSAQLPTNDSLVDGVRAFLPPPSSPTPQIESQVDAIRAYTAPLPTAVFIESQLLAMMSFLPPPTGLQSADDAQSILANKIFGR